MRRAEAAGVPVPHVLEVHSDGLVLERIDGPTMLEEIERQPWRFAGHAHKLGQLHRRILDAGLVHRDFHPLNVLLAERGPVIIDWSNGGDGPAEEDVAFSQVILATSDADFPGWLEWMARIVRRRFVSAYLDGVGMSPGPDHLREAADRRVLDPHLRERELESVRAMRRRLDG